MSERTFRNFETRNRRECFGKSSVEIKCPWCGVWVTGYIWSMAGSGKKCPGCGAIHTWLYGSAEPKRPLTPRALDRGDGSAKPGEPTPEGYTGKVADTHPAPGK